MSVSRRIKTLYLLSAPSALARVVYILFGLGLLVRVAAAQEVMPHRPLLPGFGGLCDGGPVVCTRIDSFAFNARADVILLPSTDRRGLGLVTPYGFSIGLFDRIEGGIYTHTSVWGQERAPGESSTRWQQGPMRFRAKGLLWPWVRDPHQRVTALLEFEYEARLPHFEGPNQLGLLTDLGGLRGVLNVPMGLAEVGLSAGALYDWQGRYGTAEVGARVGLHLPFLPDTKVFIEGVARGFASRIHTDEPIPGASEPTRPLVPGGALGLGLVTRQSRAVDFAVVAHAGFGDVAPFFLTLRFADVAWGQGYPRPKSLVVDAAREFSAWVREQVASIDPMFSERCQMMDDPKPGRRAESLELVAHQTPDGRHCLWSGLWLDKQAHYWKNKRGTQLCHDEERNHCFAERASPSEPWVPLGMPARRAYLRSDCVYEDADTKKLLTRFGQRTPDGRACTDGRNTAYVGQHTSYNPALKQIDLGPQGANRRGVLTDYHEPTAMEQLATRLGRGVERGQAENRQKEAEHKEAAAVADAALTRAWTEAEEMTAARLVNGIEAAEQEAEAELRHAAADPKGTFKRALDRFGRGLESAARATERGATAAVQGAQQGAQDAAGWTRKPSMEQAGDVLEVFGKAAATAPRSVTTDVALGAVTGGTVNLLGGLVKDARALGKLEHAGEALVDGKKARKLGKAAKKGGKEAAEEVAEHTDEAAARRLLKDVEEQTQKANSGRGANNLKLDERAQGPHSTFKTDANGRVTGHAEWEPNTHNPHGMQQVKRVDTQYANPHTHHNGTTRQEVPTPHVHEKSTPGGVRPARPDELPR